MPDPVTGALAIASATLRLGSIYANYSTLGERTQASLVNQEREQRAVNRQISEINIRTGQLAGERLATLQRDLGSISANAAAIGVTGGASVASARATTAGAAAQTQARTVSQASRTIRNLTERKAALEEARKQERKNMRISFAADTAQTAASVAVTEGQQIRESLR
jgi:hypothetical protein